MRVAQKLIMVALLLGMMSCGSTKKISYFQDLTADATQAITAEGQVRVRPGDKLFILVNTPDERLDRMFNIVQVGNSSTNRTELGYTVDSAGDIDFPVIGRQHIAGLTREEVASTLKEALQKSDMIKNPVVTVEFQNLTFSVLGEVKTPGRYNIDKDHITLVDALSMAGDLTINGKRENVKVIRTENGQQHAYEVDLCSAESLATSPAYLLQQDDVVFVEPNKMRARQSTTNGSTLTSIPFWMSLASFLTTLTVLIVNKK